MDCLLILGSYDDPHVARVASHLNLEDIRVYVLAHNSKENFSINITLNGEFRIMFKKQEIYPDLVWCRVKLKPIRFVSDEASSYLALSTEEWLGFYKDISYIYKESIVNDRDGATRCSFKLNQMLYAHKIGLRIPKTIITNNIRNARLFITQHKSSIAKRISSGTYVRFSNCNSDSNKRVNTILTQSVNISDLDNLNEKDFSVSPTLMQQKIQKKYDIRVFCVNNKIFSFLIYPPDNAITPIDWRELTSKSKYEQFELPSDIINKINDFMSYYKLFYGSFDFILDNKEDFWFLECNPDGQWAWLDNIVNGEISECFSKELRKRIKN